MLNDIDKSFFFCIRTTNTTGWCCAVTYSPGTALQSLIFHSCCFRTVSNSNSILCCPLLYVILWLSRFWKKELATAKPFPATSSTRSRLSLFLAPLLFTWFHYSNMCIEVSRNTQHHLQLHQYHQPLQSIHELLFLCLHPSRPWPVHRNNTHHLFPNHQPCRHYAPLPSLYSDHRLTDLLLTVVHIALVYACVRACVRACVCINTDS